MAKDNVLRLNVVVNNLQLVEKCQLLLKVLPISFCELLNRLSLLSGILDTVVVDDNVKSNVVLKVRPALQSRTYFEDSKLFHHSFKLSLKLLFTAKVEAFKAQAVIVELRKTDFAK